LKPLKSKSASVLQLTRQLIALVYARHATIARSPAVVGRTPLRRTTIEYANASARYLQIKVIRAEIFSSVYYLYNHLFAGYLGAGKRELVAGAA